MPVFFFANSNTLTLHFAKCETITVLVWCYNTDFRPISQKTVNFSTLL